MHIVLGFFVAATLVYFWARGFLIVAIMGTLAVAAIFLLCITDAAVPGMLFSIAALAIVWAPRYLRHRAGQPINGGQQARVAGRIHPLR